MDQEGILAADIELAIALADAVAFPVDRGEIVPEAQNSVIAAGLEKVEDGFHPGGFRRGLQGRTRIMACAPGGFVARLTQPNSSVSP